MTIEKPSPHFYTIFESNPRQGPGQRASTERALRRLPELAPEQRILDIGCGSGAQTLDLARATPARITAVDAHPPFIARLQQRVAAAGLGDRIRAEVGDMNALRFADGAFDVVWSEGAIFIIGFARGLAAWRRLLAPGGHLVVSEFCWFRPDPPAELVALHRDDAPDLGEPAARRAAIAAHGGYRLIDEFRLPESGWWEEFYAPMDANLERFRRDHAGDPEALAVAAQLQHEIDLYRKYRGDFGYVFFVLQRDDGTRA
jgi:SAM-dependent methyltransferase